MRHTFPDSLASKRLTMRRLHPDDAAALCAYRSLPEVARYQSWESFGPHEAAKLIEGQSGQEPGVPGTWFQLAIVETATKGMIGDCGLHCLSHDPHQFEIGITIAPQAQHRGYAVETLDCLLTFVFDQLGGQSVLATTDTLNASAAALFRRLGFRQAPMVKSVWLKGQMGGEFMFVLTKDERQRLTPLLFDKGSPV